MTHRSAWLVAVTEAKKEGFWHGYISGLKGLFLFVWHAIPVHHIHSFAHWGYFLGVLTVLAVFALVDRATR